MADKNKKTEPYYFGIRFESKDDYEKAKRSHVKEMNFKGKSFAFNKFMVDAIMKETKRVWNRKEN